MKKFVLFIVSFASLFLLLQIGSGMIVTSLYTPNLEGAWNTSAMLPQETAVQSSYLTFILTLSIGLLSAASAYFIQKKTFNPTGNTR